MKKQKGFWIGISIMVGSIVGALTDNIVIWLLVGVVVGVALVATQKIKKTPKS